MVSRLLLVGCALVAAVPVAAQTTVPIGVFSAYLHLDPADLANDALAIDLGALGLVPGYTIKLEPVGDWDAGPGDDTQTNMLGVFSGDATLLGPTNLHRVPGAIATDSTEFTGGTWPSGQPTDIPEDFFLTPSITLVIPPGAKFLFVTPADIYYRDNSDPDLDLGVKITLISTTDVTPGVPRLTLSATPNPFRHDTSIAFSLQDAARVRLAIHDVAGRMVRTLISGDRPAGSHVVRWDGRDAAGRPAAIGSYFARLDDGKRRETVKLSLVR